MFEEMVDRLREMDFTLILNATSAKVAALMNRIEDLDSGHPKD
jgi:hypothetical protein